MSEPAAAGRSARRRTGRLAPVADPDLPRRLRSGDPWWRPGRTAVRSSGSPRLGHQVTLRHLHHDAIPHVTGAGRGRTEQTGGMRMRLARAARLAVAVLAGGALTAAAACTSPAGGAGGTSAGATPSPR